LREVRTLRRLGLEPGGERLLAFEDGLPALVARDVGDGRSLLFASSLDADFTDLPLRPGFIPLLVAMIRDAAGAAGLARSHLAPGEPIDLPLAKRASGLEVGLPDGNTRKLVPDSATQRTLRFTDTAMIGAYRVQSISQDDDSHAPTHAAFVVRAPIEESDLTPGSVPAPARSRARADSSLVHKPLSNLVFLLAGLCVLVEGLARTRRRT
ncbi:MAG TPA: hypothetical protein VHM19_13860, partial [Polyangiales bacterium]|nr:hypothetical protein [Polyangiales bacterium]